MAPDNRPKYSMAIARKKTGLTDRQIRYYEQVGLINPTRTRGKQRIFTEKEIERLQEIKQLIESGLTVEGVKEEFEQREKRLAALQASTPSTNPSPKGAGGKPRLTSLYPVSNRAQLVQLLAKRKRERERGRENKSDT